MAKRVLISAIAGVLAGTVLIVPVTVSFQRHVIHDGASFAIGLPGAVGFWLLAEITGLPILGAIVASPLIVIAVATGIVFRRSIDRRPLLWTSVAPVLVWLFTCAVFALRDDSQPWMPHRGFPQRLLGTLRGVDNGLFFFAPAASALCFAVLTHRAVRRSPAPLTLPPPTR